MTTVDDERIRQLTDEVLAHLRAPAPTPEVRSLESRVAVLETALAHLLPRSGTDAKLPVDPASGTVVHIHTHPSRQLLPLAAGGGECLLEPDKPCVHSGCCRTLGH